MKQLQLLFALIIVMSTHICAFRSAQHLAAQAIDMHDEQQLHDALQLLTQAHPLSGNMRVVAVADEGFGDTIQFCYYLHEINKELQAKGIPCIRLHLVGVQQALKPLLERSGFADLITTGQLQCNQGMIAIPLISVVNATKVFAQDKQPYLIPDAAVVAYWHERIDHTRFNVVTKWRSGNKPVLGGNMLYRDIPLKMIIDIALQVDPRAHIYLIQSPPHHNIVTQSIFDTMHEQDKMQHGLNVIPDEYLHYVTQVPDSNGNDPHGPFEDSLALMTMCTYIGSDTVTAHMSGNVQGGKTIVLLPSAQAGTPSNRDWRWGTTGQCTPWYGHDRFRIIEIDLHDEQTLQPAVRIAQQWCQDRLALPHK